MLPTFVFHPLIQAGLAQGIYKLVCSNGAPIGVACLAEGTKKAVELVGYAINVITPYSSLLDSFSPVPITPLIAPLNSAKNFIQTYQNDQELAYQNNQELLSQNYQELLHQNQEGFQNVFQQLDVMKHSLGVLQATTAVIGVGVAATTVLSAVNLWQTLKLREDVKQLRLEVKEGFIDLKKALKTQGDEIIEHIDQVAQNITFNQHRLELSKAYGRFQEAIKLIKTAPLIENVSARRTELANARQTLNEALAIYNNPYLFSETSAPGKLRRFECAWIMEQAIAITYQLQGEYKALAERLNNLQTKIRQNVLDVVDSYETLDELDFLFPEVARIHDHDLVALEIWKNQAKWMSSLNLSEIQALKNLAIIESKSVTSNEQEKQENLSSTEKPPEMIAYEELKQKSHYLSLDTQMRYMMKPELRTEAEQYVSNQAKAAGYSILDTDNLELASNQAVANLYWYFAFKDPAQQEAT